MVLYYKGYTNLFSKISFSIGSFATSLITTSFAFNKTNKETNITRIKKNRILNKNRYNNLNTFSQTMGHNSQIAEDIYGQINPKFFSLNSKNQNLQYEKDKILKSEQQQPILLNVEAFINNNLESQSQDNNSQEIISQELKSRNNNIINQQETEQLENERLAEENARIQRELHKQQQKQEQKRKDAEAEEKQRKNIENSRKQRELQLQQKAKEDAEELRLKKKQQQQKVKEDTEEAARIQQQELQLQQKDEEQEKQRKNAKKQKQQKEIRIKAQKEQLENLKTNFLLEIKTKISVFVQENNIDKTYFNDDLYFKNIGHLNDNLYFYFMLSLKYSIEEATKFLESFKSQGSNLLKEITEIEKKIKNGSYNNENTINEEFKIATSQYIELVKDKFQSISKILKQQKQLEILKTNFLSEIKTKISVFVQEKNIDTTYFNDDLYFKNINELNNDLNDLLNLSLGRSIKLESLKSQEPDLLEKITEIEKGIKNGSYNNENEIEGNFKTATYQYTELVKDKFQSISKILKQQKQLKNLKTNFFSEIKTKISVFVQENNIDKMYFDNQYIFKNINELNDNLIFLLSLSLGYSVEEATKFLESLKSQEPDLLEKITEIETKINDGSYNDENTINEEFKIATSQYIELVKDKFQSISKILKQQKQLENLKTNFLSEIKKKISVFFQENGITNTYLDNQYNFENINKLNDNLIFVLSLSLGYSVEEATKFLESFKSQESYLSFKSQEPDLLKEITEIEKGIKDGSYNDENTINKEFQIVTNKYTALVENEIQSIFKILEEEAEKEKIIKAQKEKEEEIIRTQKEKEKEENLKIIISDKLKSEIINMYNNSKNMIFGISTNEDLKNKINNINDKINNLFILKFFILNPIINIIQNENEQRNPLNLISYTQIKGEVLQTILKNGVSKVLDIVKINNLNETYQKAKTLLTEKFKQSISPLIDINELRDLAKKYFEDLDKLLENYELEINEI